MNVPIAEALVRIAKSVAEQNKDSVAWAEIESDDMFQDGDYVGGFDGDEEQFCFSYYGNDREVWFQFSLETALEIAGGAISSLEGRPAER